MGQKSKAAQYGLKELIIGKWDGGKNTIIYIEEELNEWLKQNGYKITISREAIRRVVRSYEDEIADVRKGVEMAKQMAEVFRDQPGTELSEAMITHLAQLMTQNLRNITDITIDDPVKLIDSVSKLATSHVRVVQYRTEAVQALDRAKTHVKEELQKAIRHDPELLERLCKIVDNAKVA